MNKKLATALIIGSAFALAGCGRKIAEEKVPGDLATYLYQNTPDDGIDQTMDLQMDATVGKETKDKSDGTIHVPVTATITDRSIYTAEYDVVYEKTDDENDDDGWVIRDAPPQHRSEWVVTPIGDIDNDMAKNAIVKRGAMVFNGSTQELDSENVTDVEISNIQASDDKNTVSADAVFHVVDKVVTYEVHAKLTFNHTINGYEIAESEITSWDAVLNDAYAFNVADQDLISILKTSAVRVGDLSVDLASISAVKERHNTFNPEKLTMDIIAQETLSNDYYDAVVKVYYVYKLDEGQKYWTLDRYYADNFHVVTWKNMTGVYEGKIGKNEFKLDISNFKDDGTFNAVLVYPDDTDMEMSGRISPDDLTVNMQELDGSMKLKGAFSADMGVFAGDYGADGRWYAVDEKHYQAYLDKKKAESGTATGTSEKETDEKKDDAEKEETEEKKTATVKKKETVTEEEEEPDEETSKETATEKKTATVTQKSGTSGSQDPIQIQMDDGTVLEIIEE